MTRRRLNNDRNCSKSPSIIRRGIGVNKVRCWLRNLHVLLINATHAPILGSSPVPQDVYVLRSYHLGREITAVLPCTLWAALSFAGGLRRHAQARADVALSWHRAKPAPENGVVRSITTWGASALPQAPMARGDFALPLDTHRPTLRGLDAVSVSPLNPEHCFANG